MLNVLILNDSYNASHHGSNIVMDQIFHHLKKRKVNIISTHLMYENWKECKIIFKKNPKISFVIVNGEGTFHDDAQGAVWILECCEYIKKKLNIPIFLINTVYQNNTKELSNRMKIFDYIYVRESYSKLELTNDGIQCQVVPDLVFYTLNNIYDLTKNQKLNIGVIDSVYNDLSIKLLKLSRSNNYKYLPIYTYPNIFLYKHKRWLLRLIKYYSFDLPSIILKNIIFPSYFFKKSVDENHINKNRESIVNYFISNYKKYIKIICQSSLIISARFHGVVFCLIAKTPFIAFSSNTHKIESLITDIGINKDRIINNTEEIEGKLIKCSQYSDNEKKLISEYLNQANIKIDIMFDEIISQVNLNK